MGPQRQSTTTIDAAGAGVGQVPLSAYDQFLGAGPPLIRVFLFSYVPDIDALNVSLRKALHRFPRFATAIVTSNAGALALEPLRRLPEVELQPPMAWTADQIDAGRLAGFARASEFLPGQPVFAATLTPVSNGAVLGVRLSHAAGDAHSFYMLLSCWNDQFLASQRHGTAQAPAHGPSSGKSERARGEPSKHRNVGPEMLGGAKRLFSVLSLPKEFLASLRAELATDQFVPSMNEAVTAFIVHRHGQAIMGSAAGLRLRVPVNLRGTHPALPAAFVGNAFLEAVIALDDLVDTPIAARETAYRIRNAVQEVRSHARVQSAIRIGEGGVEFAANIPTVNRRTDLVSTNHTRMPLYRMDFGNGPPARVLCPFCGPNGIVISSVSNGVEAQIVSAHAVVSGTT
jgi:hypothetical protein